MSKTAAAKGGRGEKENRKRKEAGKKARDAPSKGERSGIAGEKVQLFPSA